MRILLVDDNADFRATLRTWLQIDPRLQIVGEAADRHEAVRLALAADPEVVLMDVMLADGLSASVTREILTLCPGVEVIALSIHDDSVYVDEMTDAGAAAYVRKGSVFEELPGVLDEVVRKPRSSAVSPRSR